ncbi:MAG: hypothetical protein DI539_10175, partial [Flavobacterium psychrophilum]
AVCYVNELLEFKPYDKNLWLKKIGLYNLMGDTVEANRQLKRLYQIFPEDKEVKAMYTNTLKESAVNQDRKGNTENSAKQYEEVLAVNKKDAESYISLINAYSKVGNYDSALATADKGLNALPGNKEILDKKIGILEQMHEYQRAIDIVRVQQKKGNNAHYNQLLNYLMAEAARYYRNSDPYELYGKVYEKDKSNKEAKDYLLNTAVSRGYYGDAQELLTKELKKNPSSKQLLSKQLYVYESQQNRQGARATIQKLYDLYGTDSDIKDRYEYYIFQDAKDEFRDGNYAEALPVFKSLVNSAEYGKPANNYIYSVYLEQRAYGKALDHIEGLIKAYPEEQEYILKKIDLLADMGDYENAYTMAKHYADLYKDDTGYRYMLTDISFEYMKYLQEKEEFETIKTIADEILVSDPDTIEAYQYAIAARTYMNQYDEAMTVVNQALVHFPDSKELRLKQAGLYSAMGDHKKASDALFAMEKDYPYNNSIRNSLVEEMMLHAKEMEKKDEGFEAMNIYREVMLLKPSDTLAPYKLANHHINRKEYNDAMKVLDTALQQNKDNQSLLYLKGVVYENLNDFALAKEYQEKYTPPAHKAAEYKDHMDYLNSRLLKNQISVTYLKATADTIPFNLSVGTLEYTRYAKKDTYVVRGNYTGKDSGVGLQGEVDWYHTFKNKSYFLANGAVGSKFFPKFRGAFSFYQPFAKTWQAELGGRYLYLQDNRSLYTGIVGIEKSIGDVWLNARVSLITPGSELYHNVLGQARFYMRDAKDYLQAMASVGNAPEDLSLDFQINNTLSFPTTMIGAGYFHSIGYKTVFGVIGNWYNYHITDDLYTSQYTLLFTVRTKF